MVSVVDDFYSSYFPTLTIPLTYCMLFNHYRCGHCKQLKPEYKQVAKAFQNVCEEAFLPFLSLTCRDLSV